jgi:hypothetical protein
MRVLQTMSAAAALAIAVIQFPALAQQAGASTSVPIRGTVVSVDRTDGSVVLRYAPPGSQPTTRHRFVLTNHNDAIRLHSGTVIDGTADTTHPVWTMSNVNVESDKPMRGD